MFNKDKSNTSDRLNANATMIAEGTTLKGDLHSNHDLRIDGTIHGNVSSSAKIVIGPSGKIEGNMEGRNADISGKVNGNIQVSEILQLRAQCQVQGDITAETLQVDPSAVFNGKCKMGTAGVSTSVVKMNHGEEAKVAIQ
jgi:cytoskeletal protein CcmA (bactofilin family)